MPTFAFTARDRSGQKISGTREAADRRTALEELREHGLFVTQLQPSEPERPQRAPARKPPRRSVAASSRMASGESPMAASLTAPGIGVPRAPRRIESEEPEGILPREARFPDSNRPFLRANAKQLSLYFRQMHAMLHAGTVVGQALSVMGENAPNSGLRRASQEMALRVSRGHPLSDTMRSYPGLFSELMIGMIAAGEKGGFLDRMCLRLSEYSERDYDLQMMIKKETWYPKLLIFASIFIPSAVPLVLAVVQGGNPLAAWIHYVFAPVALIGMIWGSIQIMNYFAPVTLRTGPVRYVIDYVKLLIPLAGKTARALATAKFCRALGALQAAGMAPHRTIAMAANACGNEVIGRRARNIIPKVERGESFTEALASTHEFPGVALQMMRTGEQTGHIEEQLDKVADFLEEDAEATIKKSVVAGGMLIFLLIGCYIGYTVVQFWSGFYNGIMNDYGKP
jgi:type II secretory pathway component PulF